MSAPTNSGVKIAGATTALVLLTALNFINYTDRYILPGVQTLVQREFHLDDASVGTLTTCFFITYMLAAPLTGWLGDRFPRKPLIVTGALLWCGCNMLTAFVHSYAALNVRHAALGIGEASFGIFAPALLSDFFPEQERNRALTIFYIAIPVGAAIGYSMGGMMAPHYGWRMPFIVSAIPGIVLALLIAVFMREPERGAAEPNHARIPTRSTVTGLARNWGYVTATLGMAMIVFSLGGISWWMPTFLNRMGGYSLGSAGMIVGATSAVGGLAGTAVGGWLAQIWLKRDERALYWVSALSALLAVPAAMLCFLGPRGAMIPGLAFAIFFIMLGNGPLNAAIVNAVGPEIRASAVAIELFLIHALGDAPSPWLIGRISDLSNLRLGLVVTLGTMVLAAALLWAGAMHYRAEHGQTASSAAI
jgi:predicted MFS family arabinose efflux permease